MDNLKNNFSFYVLHNYCTIKLYSLNKGCNKESRDLLNPSAVLYHKFKLLSRLIFNHWISSIGQYNNIRLGFNIWTFRRIIYGNKSEAESLTLQLMILTYRVSETAAQ